MNVKLANQQLRFRITASELQMLLVKQSLQTTITLPDKSCLIFHVVPHNTLKTPFSLKHFRIYWNILFLRREKYNFYLYVSKQTLVDLNKKIPSKEGFTTILNNGSSDPLKVTLEVDIF